MLGTAIEAEVQEFILVHGDRRDAGGNRLVVRNGYQPARELLTGAGRLEVQQPRVRDNSAEKECRVRFSSSILPPYLRRSKAIDELIPWLYLKGISTGDFSEALQSLLGEAAHNLSPNVVVRLKGSGVKSTTSGAVATSAKSCTCMFGRTASTSTCAWKMRPINGSACSC